MASSRTVARMRALLLLTLALLVLGLGGLYWFGRAGRSAPSPPPRPDPNGPGGTVKAVGQGFSFTLEDNGRTMFSIESKGYQVNTDDTVSIDGMGVEIFSPQGETYRVESAKALFNRETNEAHLSGGAHVYGPSNVEVESETLELTQKGNLVTSETPATFRWSDTAEGTSERFRVNLAEKLYLLAGGVRFHSLPTAETPFHLTTRRLTLDRLRHHLRLDHDADLGYGTNVLRANQINLWMEDDEKTPILLKARRLVRGRVASNLTGGTLGPVRFQGRWLVGYFKPGSRDLDHLELSGPAIEPALVLTRAPGEAPRRLLASRLIGSFQGGALSRAEAVGGVRLAELRREPPDEDWTHFTPSADTDSLDAEGEDEEEDEPGEQAGPLQGVSLDISPRPFDSFEEDALRVATAPRAEAVLGAEGGLVEVLLTGEVWIRDQRYTAQGNQARFDYANGVGEFLGTPATVVASQGEIKAPRFLYTERSGLLFASGGTRSQLKQDPKGGAGLAAGPLGKGEGPVWVESQEAFFRQSDRTFLFRGKVKAWRGENLLRADEMQGDEASGRLSAKGNVNTLVIGEGAGPAKSTTPTEVTAETFNYSRTERQLHYQGNVRSRQADRNLSSDEMTVELDEAQKAKSVTLVGSVTIEDPATQRTVTGDRAHYDLATRQVEVVGQKVVVREKDGGEVTGQKVIYEVGTGRLEVIAGQPAPAGGKQGP